MNKSFSLCTFIVQNIFISVLYFHSIGEINKKEAGLVVKFPIFYERIIRKEIKIVLKRIKSAVALPYIQVRAPKRCLIDKIMLGSRHLLVLTARNVKTGAKFKNTYFSMKVSEEASYHTRGLMNQEETSLNC